MVQTLRLAFAGTPDFAAAILGGLVAGKKHSVCAVLTQPDRRAGRGRRALASPVKQLAGQFRIPVHQPATPAELNGASVLHAVDALIVVAFGMLLPKEILARPRLGCLNVHPSLLPRWRGAAPIPRAIEAGDDMTGVSIMQMDIGLDTGDVLMQRSCPILDDDTAGSLGKRLATMGYECLADALDALAAGTATRTAQDGARATYARKISKDELHIDWSRPARDIERSVRAYSPEPLARTELESTTMLIWQATALPDAGRTARPGSVIAAGTDGIDVMTGEGILRILTLQLPGKRPISAADLVNARPQWKRGA
ncbi:MAG: methionyl-tRNA formyltransferase [Gammaproteobacteria bacterium]|nr:methionyl-tRNA formyltransferase [Gammaproteobacteria bacterium]